MDDVVVIRPVPDVEHEVDVRPGAHRVRLFELEQMAEPDPRPASPADLGAEDLDTDLGGFAHSPVSVVVEHSVQRQFTMAARFSRQVEEGGFLAGQVFRGPGGPGGFIVKVTAAIKAERSGASRYNFTFTGESFLRIGEQISARPGQERLLGWYHTHLFPATDALGLSSVDIDLHRSTFRLPWQVAALVNLTRDGRMLRFYRADGQGMALAPYWVVPR
jgi:hypothetical protein